MAFEVIWESRAGTQTEDNRDCCGIGQRPDSTLCVILDGSTTGQESGEFASSIARALIDWFVAASEVNNALILDQLRQVHSEQTTRFRQASASFAIAWADKAGHVRFYYAGDCLIGNCSGEAEIEWVTRPHTLANVLVDLSIEQIATSSSRHRVTRSLRAKEFMMPETGAIMLMRGDTLILATDGFWADLGRSDQMKFLNGGESAKREPRDDRSVLSVRLQDGEKSIVNRRKLTNLFVRTIKD